MSAPPTPCISGYVAPGFEPVRQEFESNFQHRGERSAACVMFHRGEKVVDLWGGYRCPQTRAARTRQTLTLAFSVTKGMAAAALAVAHSRRYFHLDEPVSTYWPEFEQAGKRRITVRQLLAHQAGLVGIASGMPIAGLTDLDRRSAILAQQPPLWQPGTRHGYHTLTLGWYQSELIRRTDPRGRSLGEFFQDEVARPLGIEFYFGLPTDFPIERVSVTEGFHRLRMLAHLHELPADMVLAGIWPRSLVARSVGVLPLHNPAQLGDPPYRHLEIPAAVGFGTAEAVARVYDMLARGGHELGVSRSTWRELIAPATAPSLGNWDAIFKLETKYTLGFSRPSRGFHFGTDQAAFGCPGAGGSFGYADPTAELGFCYLTSKMGFRLFDDPREKAVRVRGQACAAASGIRRMAA